MRKYLLSEALLATTLAACNGETGLSALNTEPEHELVPLEPLPETTTEPVELPIPPFSVLIDNCLKGLDLPPCPPSDANCVALTSAEKTAIEGFIVSQARAASGDSAMTLEDIEGGAYVPASVYGHYVLSEGGEYGRNKWSNYAYNHIAFGDKHEAEFRSAYEGEAELAPYETIPGVATLSCHGQAHSYDGMKTVVSQEVYITTTAADGTTHKVSVSRPSSEQWVVNGFFYDVASGVDFDPTQEALDLGVEGALEAAFKTAGDAGVKNSKVNQY